MVLGRTALILAITGGAVLACRPMANKETQGPDDAQSAAAQVLMTAPEELAKQIKTDPTPFTIINVWATWCPPCLHELPEFVRFYREMDTKNVRLFSIVVMSDPEKSVKPVLEKNRVPFPVCYAAIASPDELVYVLDLETEWDGALPATFVLNQEGKLVRTWFEEVSAADLADAVKGQQ